MYKPMFWPPKSAPKLPPPGTWCPHPKSMRRNKPLALSLDDAFDEDPPVKKISPPTTGIKYDTEKPDYSLVPPQALEDTVKVLTLGAQKYDRDNWKELENAKQRYFAAAQRHMWARRRGELIDSESGLDHCAHAICCLMFILELEHLGLNP